MRKFYRSLMLALFLWAIDLAIFVHYMGWWMAAVAMISSAGSMLALAYAWHEFKRQDEWTWDDYLKHDHEDEYHG